MVLCLNNLVDVPGQVVLFDAKCLFLVIALDLNDKFHYAFSIIQNYCFGVNTNLSMQIPRTRVSVEPKSDGDHKPEDMVRVFSP